MFCQWQGKLSLKGLQYSQPIQDGIPLTGNPDHKKVWWLYSYKAPEMETDFVHDKSVDLWSFGVTMYMLMTYMVPFHGEKGTLFKNKHTGNIAEFVIVSPSRPAQRLVRNLLQVNPADRPTIDQVLNSEWMVETNKRLDRYDLSLTKSFYEGGLEE